MSVSLTREFYRAFRDVITLPYLRYTQILFSFYDSKHVPGSRWVLVSFHLSYVDDGEPARVEINYAPTLDTCDFKIEVKLNRGYDVFTYGEPTVPSAYKGRGVELLVARIMIGKLNDHTAYIITNPYDLMVLYSLEARHRIVSLTVDELERRKQRVAFDEYEERDFDSVSNLLRWIRDNLFPLLDQILGSPLDPPDKLEARDIYWITSLLEFITKPD